MSQTEHYDKLPSRDGRSMQAYAMPPRFAVCEFPKQMSVMREWSKFFDAVYACPEGSALILELDGMSVAAMRENIRRYAKRLHTGVSVNLIAGKLYVTRTREAVRRHSEIKMPPRFSPRSVVMERRA